jgi:hypothetical protein
MARLNTGKAISGLERGGQQVAEEAVAVLGGAGRHHHIAWLDLLGRHMHHPVVARLQQHGDGGAAQARLRIDRPDAGLHQTQTAHGLVHRRNAEARQRLHRGLVRAQHLAVHHAQFLQRVHVRTPWR